MTNLALKDDQPGRDNSWWAEPAFAENLFEASKTIPSSTWSTIVKSTSKKKDPFKRLRLNGSRPPFSPEMSLSLSVPG
jgi:hypothetical protein